MPKRDAVVLPLHLLQSFAPTKRPLHVRQSRFKCHALRHAFIEGGSIMVGQLEE